MTYDELMLYWVPVAKKFFRMEGNTYYPLERENFPIGLDLSDLDGIDGHLPNQAVDRMLGIDEYVHGYYHTQRSSPPKPISEELKQLLIALTGPHGYAILKIYRIQKGLDKYEDHA